MKMLKFIRCQFKTSNHLRFALSAFAWGASFQFANAQIGIGTTTPQARLHVYGGSVLSKTPTLGPEESPVYDPLSSDDDPVHHVFKWIHEKGAFRSMGSSIYSQGLDPVLSGRFSHASGFDTRAEGMGSVALGIRSVATGMGSFANGRGMIAANNFSFAHGFFSSADGPHCVVIGSNLSNNYLTGSFIFGTATGSAQSTDNHQMKMLFDGGYRFFTNSNVSIGVNLGPGENSWSIVSDRNKKEKFSMVDGREFLKKIGAMPLTSWNYKGQEPTIERHYGPMAQDFFKAFGKDAYGTIGADTIINQADLDGVTLIAIQSLIEVTDELEKMNDSLVREITRLRSQVSVSKVSSRSRRRNVLLTGR